MFVILVLPAAAQTGRATGGAATTLAELRDRARVLLIFAPESKDARLQTQLKWMRDNAADAAERDLVTIAAPERGPWVTGTRLTQEAAAAARRSFHARDGEFLVILVGKDGGEKLRSLKPIPFERLRAAIDAMPMRQEERKARAH